MIDDILNPKVVDVYPYCKEQGETFFLLMKRSAHKVYGGQWRMVGGKVAEGEKAWQTAKREFYEETALKGKLWWCVPSINHFYDPKGNLIHLIPAFAVECEPFAQPVLNEEHDDFRWVKASECENFVRWPEQNRLILLIQKLTQHKILPEWLLED